MDKTTTTLYISFNDESGKKKNISVRNPADGISGTQVKAVADTIIDNNLILGDVGHLKTYNGAYIVQRTTNAIA